MIPRNLCLFSQDHFQSVAMFTPNATFEERSSVISETPPPTITFVSLVRHCSVSFPTDIHVTHQISLGKAFPVGKTFPTPIPTYIVNKHIDGHVTCVTAFSICLFLPCAKDRAHLNLNLNMNFKYTQMSWQ